MKAQISRVNRRRKGSALTEMGPAMYILLIFIFFPALDLLAMAVAYTSSMYLNVLQTKAAALTKNTDNQSPTGEVQKAVVDQWLGYGVGQFVHTTEKPKTQVFYSDGQTDPSTKITDKIVRVQTTVTCLPFLTIPWFTPVPGMSAPMTFTFNSTATVENPDNANL